MRLNLGCGFNKPDGFVHVDMFEECQPDIVHNLETFPYPFEDSSIEEILFNHSLEHIGQQPSVFLRIIQEVYRICKDEALIEINVPHPRHDNFLSDPTHVRAITPMTLQLFDLDLNKHWQKIKAANSPFAIYLGVNFKLLSVNISIEQLYVDQLNANKITHDELQVLVNERNNVATEYRFTWKAVKSGKP